MSHRVNLSLTDGAVGYIKQKKVENHWLKLESYVLLYPQNTSNIEGETLKIEKLQLKVHALHHHTVNTHSGQIAPCACGAGAITHAEVERALTE